MLKESIMLYFIVIPLLVLFGSDILLVAFHLAISTVIFGTLDISNVNGIYWLAVIPLISFLWYIINIVLIQLNEKEKCYSGFGAARTSFLGAIILGIMNMCILMYKVM